MKQSLFALLLIAFTGSAASAAGSPNFMCQVDLETAKPFTLEQDPITYNYAKTLVDSKGLKITLLWGGPPRPDLGFNFEVMLLEAQVGSMKVSQQSMLQDSSGGEGSNLQIDAGEAGIHNVNCRAFKTLPPGF